MPEQTEYGDIWRRVQERAYLRWAARNGAPGSELEDWCAAEREEIEAAARNQEQSAAELEAGLEKEVQAHARMDRIDPAAPTVG